MREKINGIGNYFSCMILFNLIYLLSILSNALTCEKNIKNYGLYEILMLGFIIFFILGGVIYTIILFIKNDKEKNIATTGKKFKVISVKDLTGENYFSNFSLIVLTGLSLDKKINIYTIVIFLLIEAALGLVYIKKKMFYMNPILALLNYSIFECTGKDDVTQINYEGEYYFITKRITISQDMVITYKNIDSHIIIIKD